MWVSRSLYSSTVYLKHQIDYPIKRNLCQIYSCYPYTVVPILSYVHSRQKVACLEYYYDYKQSIAPGP